MPLLIVFEIGVALALALGYQVRFTFRHGGLLHFGGDDLPVISPIKSSF